MAPEIPCAAIRCVVDACTTDNYECTWDLYRSVPSLLHEGKTVFEEFAAYVVDVDVDFVRRDRIQPSVYRAGFVIAFLRAVQQHCNADEATQ
jgi:oleate hydratase